MTLLSEINSIIAISQFEPRRIFKSIGQIVKAFVQKSITDELYLVRFSDTSLLVQSKEKLKEKENIWLRVESLRPEVVLKKIPQGISPKQITVFSFSDAIKTLKENNKEIAFLLRDIFDLKKFGKEDFWDAIKKILLQIRENNKSSRYISFLKEINQQINGLYIQLPSFYSLKDPEMFFYFKKSNAGRRYAFHIKVKLSFLGTVSIFIEDSLQETEIIFGVSRKEVKEILKREIPALHDNLKKKGVNKKIHIDCDIFPEEYVELPLYRQLKEDKIDISI